MADKPKLTRAERKQIEAVMAKLQKNLETQLNAKVRQ